MLLLSDDDVRFLLTQKSAREVVKKAAAAYSSGRAVVPSRIQMTVPAENAEVLVMPGLLPDEPVLGLKTVTEFPGNLAKGLPTAPACLLILDPHTGMPSAVINATFLTLIRTAAMTVVAAEYLAVANPSSVGIIGAGGQAMAHIDAFIDRFPISTIRLYSRTSARAWEVAEQASEAYPLVQFSVVQSAEAACEGTDIVVAATTAHSPVVSGAALGPGQLFCGIGSHQPSTAEIPPEVVQRAARVVVDTRSGSIDGAGDISSVISSGALDRGAVSELGDLVNGTRPGRQDPSELCVFKSIGFAALDLAAAAVLIPKATEQGIGLVFDI